MKPIPTLETERLTLRAFRLDDAAAVQRLAGDRLIADTTLSIPHPYEDGMAQEWIAQQQPDFDQCKGVTFAVTRKADGALVGAIGLVGMAAGHKAELGYWIGRPFWNQGFCTEASEAVLRYAFTDLGLMRVHCAHFSRNPASGRVMRKLGMQHEGTRRWHLRKWDQFEDSELYGILKNEWKRGAKSHSMRLIRYQAAYREPMLALHRSAIEGFTLGMSQQEDEADLVAVEDVYLRSRGEFLLGFVSERLVAMGGFKRLSDGVAELRRMRIARDLQGQGYGTLMLRELEWRAFQSGIRTLCLDTARRRPLTLEFYRKHGYQETGRSFYGAVETVQFSKTLDERGCERKCLGPTQSV